MESFSTEALGDLTLASRAGSSPKPQFTNNTALERIMKTRLRITARTFEVDWEKFILLVQTYGIAEADAVVSLPFVVEDSLFILYKKAAARLAISTIEEAHTLLKNLVGSVSPNSAYFLDRKWKFAEETAQAYLCDLRNMASVLNLPEDMIRTQFLRGLPQSFSDRVEIFTCHASLDQVADTLQTLQSKSHLNDIHGHANCAHNVSIDSLRQEIAALKSISHPDIGKCYRCGKSGHWASNCTHSQPTCYRCGRVGHLKKFCPKNGVGPVVRPAKY